MTDAAPRLFRSLETAAGRDGFDTVVLAAAAAYASLRSPSDRQARDLGRLVAPVWPKITPDTQRSLSAMLSRAPRVPRVLLDLLIGAPVEISAPFLLSSPALSPADLSRLALIRDARLDRVLAGRAARTEHGSVEAPTGEAPASAPEERETRPARHPEPAPDPAKGESTPSPIRPELEAPRFVALAPPLSPERLPPLTPDDPEAAPSKAESVRQALRRLVGGGRRARPLSDEVPSRDALLRAALNRDEEGFYGALSRLFDLQNERLRPIIADETGERLAVALKAARFGAADALSILMMLKPRIGLDVAAFERMSGFYRALGTEDCRALVMAGPASKHRPVAVDAPGPREGSEPHRPQFGRRKIRPEARARETGS